MKTNGIVSLNYVVASLLNELRLDDKDREYLTQLCIDGYTDLNIHHTTNIEVAYLTVSDINTVDLPRDYVDYTVIGVVKNGKVWTFTKDNRIPIPRTESCGEDTNENQRRNDTTATDTYNFVEHYYNGCYTPALYGRSGGLNNAYYRIDKERRRIIFQGVVPGNEIILEYKSSGIKTDGSTVIPRHLVPVIKAYTHWKRIEYDSRVPMGEKDRKRMQYGEELKKAHAFEVSFTLDEYLDARYSKFKRGVKR